MDLLERRRPLRWKARVYLDFAYRILPWTKHPRDGVELARHAFDAAMETGDLTFAAYACNIQVTLSLLAGAPLAAILHESDVALAFMQKLKFGMMIDVAATNRQLIRSLRGMTQELGSFDDEAFAENQFEQHLEAAPSFPVCWYWVHKLQARFRAGDHAGAVAAAAKARPLLWTIPSFPAAAEHVFYAAQAAAVRARGGRRAPRGPGHLARRRDRGRGEGRRAVRPVGRRARPEVAVPRMCFSYAGHCHPSLVVLARTSTHCCSTSSSMRSMVYGASRPGSCRYSSESSRRNPPHWESTCSPHSGRHSLIATRSGLRSGLHVLEP